MTETTSSDSDRAALGSRENFWGDSGDDDDSGGGHQETTGRDPAHQIARGLVLNFEQPLCRRQQSSPPNRGFAPLFAWLDGEPTGLASDRDAMHTENKRVELTEPELYLPRTDIEDEDYVDRAPNNARRYNPESGYVNYGEGTGTGLPEFDEDRYWQCVGLYLIRRYSATDGDGSGLSLTQLDEYVEYAGQIWSDPTQNSLGSLTQFIDYVREQEDDD